MAQAAVLLKLGLFTDGLPDMPFEQVLDEAVKMGIQVLEIATGGYSCAPHLDMEKLLHSAEARREFMHAIESRGLELYALNCSACPALRSLCRTISACTPDNFSILFLSFSSPAALDAGLLLFCCRRSTSRQSAQQTPFNSGALLVKCTHLSGKVTKTDKLCRIYL